MELLGGSGKKKERILSRIIQKLLIATKQFVTTGQLARWLLPLQPLAMLLRSLQSKHL